MSSILVEICAAAALALVGTGALIYAGVASFNKVAKAKGLREKGYSFGSVVAGAVISFLTLFCLICYELFLKVR